MERSRAELEQQLEALQERNRKLKSQLSLQAARNQELQVSLRDAAVSTEQEEEHLTNMLMRRLQTMQREKQELSRQLQEEERKKAEQAELLMKLKKNRSALEKHLRKEEHEIRERLERQLGSVQQQRQEMQGKLEREATTLQQLHEYVKSLKDGALQAMSPSTTGTPAGVKTFPSLRGNPAAENSSSGLLPLPQLLAGDQLDGSVTDASRSLCSSAQSATVAAASAAAPLSIREAGNGETTTPVGHSNSGTVSDGDRTPVSSRRSLGGCDDDMLRVLETEIQLAEVLKNEASSRAEDYSKRVAYLQEKIRLAEDERNAQRATVESTRQEVNRTTSAVHELLANQEVLAEWTIDREVLHQRSSSVCSSSISDSAATSEATPRVLHARH